MKKHTKIICDNCGAESKLENHWQAGSWAIVCAKCGSTEHQIIKSLEMEQINEKKKDS